MTKYYWLFAYDTYYPNGGWEDCIGKFTSLEEAEAAIPGKDWWHIVTINEDGDMEVVLGYIDDYYYSGRPCPYVPLKDDK